MKVSASSKPRPTRLNTPTCFQCCKGTQLAPDRSFLSTLLSSSENRQASLPIRLKSPLYYGFKYWNSAEEVISLSTLRKQGEFEMPVVRKKTNNEQNLLYKSFKLGFYEGWSFFWEPFIFIMKRFIKFMK